MDMATVLSLPFSFAGDDVAIGAREKFNIEVKDGTLVIFPVKEFKATNLIVFEKKDRDLNTASLSPGGRWSFRRGRLDSKCEKTRHYRS